MTLYEWLRFEGINVCLSIFLLHSQSTGCISLLEPHRPRCKTYSFLVIFLPLTGEGGTLKGITHFPCNHKHTRHFLALKQQSWDLTTLNALLFFKEEFSDCQVLIFLSFFYSAVVYFLLFVNFSSVKLRH